MPTKEHDPLKGIGVAKTLVCIELPGQIQVALKLIKQLGSSNILLLALTPHVEYALEKLGQAYKRPEDYHSEEEINQVFLADLDRLDPFCSTVDTLLQRQWELLAEHDIRPASLTWYSLKILFNCVSVRAFILQRILDEERPSHVLYFGTREEPVGRDLYFVRESPWSRVIPIVCGALGVPHETIGRKSDPTLLNHYPKKRGQGFAGEVKWQVRRILGPSGIRFLQDGLARAKRAGRRPLPSFPINGKSGRRWVLALENSFSLRFLLQKMESEEDFNVVYWKDYKDSRGTQHLAGVDVQSDGPSNVCQQSSQALKERGRKLWTDTQSLPEFRQLLWFDNIDCFPAMERRLRRFFQITVPEIVETYLRARSLLTGSPLEDSRPSAVMASTMGDHEHQAVALAAKQENVPFIVYRHGAGSGYVMMESWLSPVQDYNDLKRVDYVLGFGQGDVEYLSKSKISKAKIIPVGSVALDHLRRPVTPEPKERLLRKYGLRPDRRTIMYVPTTMDGNVRVGPYRSRSPSRAFAIEREILEVFQEFPNLQFVVKLYESPTCPCSPIAQLVKDRRLKNVRVMVEPFSSVIGLADMFITDYASTSFLEMLTTDRPVLFCGYQFPWPWAPGKWHPSLLEMWQERVGYADGLDEFLELLRTYLREERFQAVHSQDTLLKEFGTHLDDGRSIDRAYAFIESLDSQRADPVAPP